jgi:hypothetical protein
MLEGKPTKPIKDQVEVPDKIQDVKLYGMHRHFTDARSVLLFGGGMKRGHVHGVTADERPCKTIKDRVAIEDLHATCFRESSSSNPAHMGCLCNQSARTRLQYKRTGS